MSRSGEFSSVRVSMTTDGRPNFDVSAPSNMPSNQSFFAMYRAEPASTFNSWVLYHRRCARPRTCPLCVLCLMAAPVTLELEGAAALSSSSCMDPSAACVTSRLQNFTHFPVFQSNNVDGLFPDFVSHASNVVDSHTNDTMASLLWPSQHRNTRF